METSSVSTALAAQATTATTAESGTSAVSTDFETFLNMLTVQMQNQDPLNPVESTDFAVQLATFSTVEQQVLTNDYLATLTAALTGTDMADGVEMLGRGVRSAAATYFDGSEIELTPLVATAADSYQLVVRDSDGTEVARKVVSDPSADLTWDGLDESGTVVDAGLYSFVMENYADETLIATTPVETWSIVTEVQQDSGQTLLKLAGDTLIYASEVTGVRQ